MKVFFFKHDEAKRICGWEAVRGKRARIPGTLMGYGAGLPHDLAQYVVEAATGFDRGFWGLVARGATFRSMRRRRTKPGRAVVAAALDDAAVRCRLAGAGSSRLSKQRPGDRRSERATILFRRAERPPRPASRPVSFAGE